ncbi:related to polyketide synthase [Cephalotrichum gorgonifer]|uniref:Related to polyketide synthase n=1 Tax=Cephalotrichum gorgonifer TaxID=2041049 RepID=A0AAE8N781_9PEZI|nr:related to polyketide synthase [Cephalotrichum gorgonifer]
MAAKNTHGYPNEPIAIVGSACRFPGDSSSPSKLWDLLREPRDVLQEISDSRFNPDGFYHKDPLHHGTSNVRHAYLLNEDVGLFDAQFFGIKPVEANSVDPQQRILLEVVYEGLERAGLQLERLQGSQTGVYVGVMSADYMELLARDIDAFPTYFASGTARSILSNRISYFFDWHGPSMTIDTACSSSLFALHLAVQSLRNGESSSAVVAGANLALSPEQFVAESKLTMLSPDGRSRMWDKDANGYARGDGVAALVLKTLSAALADGDTIECVIRETGINQDGRTKGITMPSPAAQSDLIWSTYRKAGLDLTRPADRPQYFEAHGTGTPAGDPVEAEAISTAFFGSKVGFERSASDPPLYVGSIKTVIGHTEGTAGVAGIMKGSLALQNGIVPPNLLLNELNPKVQPFYRDLKIPKQAAEWPTLAPGAVRRVSINSFGFGGANAHAILEEYKPVSPPPAALPQNDAQISPFNFSASSEKALAGILSSYAAYLRENPSTSLRDLSWSLNVRRSTLPSRISVAAPTTEILASKLETLAKAPSGVVTTSSRAASGSENPRVLGVFTGQGAQWASMGAKLLATSALASDRLADLQKSLDSLPAEHVPEWRLSEELSKDKSTSRISDAAFSQPLCTALQIVIVDYLKAAGIKLSAVVGHSSGEIAAAYAAGYVSAEDAIQIAYYRGYFLHLAEGPEGSGGGAMMAVGITEEDARDLLELEDLEGRICIAASNSPQSLTLSGDSEAIDLARRILEDEKKFARLLKVDKAYHSHHMLPSSGPYNEALTKAGIKIQARPLDAEYPSWISSVYGEDIEIIGTESLSGEYWVRNMTNQVLFTQALEQAISTSTGPFDLAIEVGPHPALQSPALQTFTAVAGSEVPYVGTLRRGSDDVEALSEGLGSVWKFLGSRAVDFSALDSRLYGDESQGQAPPKLLTGLPSYAWEHDRVYWHESRYSKNFRTSGQLPHQLLGTKLPDGTESEIRWKNYLHLRELPWLVHHQVDRQVVFPAAGYLSATIEAVVQTYGIRSIQLIELYDVHIGQALVLEENSSVETLFSFRVIETEATHVEAVFAFFSASTKDSVSMSRNAHGNLRITLGTPSPDVLPSPYKSDREFLDLDPERFYNTVGEIGLGYGGPFKKIVEARRRSGESSGVIQTPDEEDQGDIPLIIHPGTLDCAIQSIILAYSFPGDGRIQSIFLPTSIDRLRVDPSGLANRKGPTASKLPFFANITSDEPTDLSGDVEIYSEDSSTTLVQLQGLRTTPLTPPAPSNDLQLFFKTSWHPDAPTGNPGLWERGSKSYDYDLAFAQERVAYYYLRRLDEAIPPVLRLDLEWYHRVFYEYIDHTLAWVSKGTHPFAKAEWANDTKYDLLEIFERFPESIDLRIMRAVGTNLVSAMQRDMNILEAMMKDNMLNEFYATSLGMREYLLDMARMVGQLSHRYPHLNVLEIGAGTGGATDMVFQQLQESFTSYTYTDISSGFFENAQTKFEQHRAKMIFKVLDIEKDIVTQGYAPHSFDVVIASLVLHATRDLEETMRNVRKLLKPGGRLIMLEITDNDPIRFGFIFGGLPGWWLGYDQGRKLSPCVGIAEWEALMAKTGFSPIEALTSHSQTFPLPLSVIATQALDDRVTFLREPLALDAEYLGLDSLTILGGGRSTTVDSIARALEAAVSHQYKRKPSRILFLEDVSQQSLPVVGTLVSLVDLEDEPTFERMTSAKLAALQEIFKQSKAVLWVTRGALSGSPYRNMYRGLQRTMEKELKDLKVQMLDFASDTNGISGTAIASKLLQLEAHSTWERTGRSKNLLWYPETEILVRNGESLVPRIRLDAERNRRYNSGRRLITQKVSLDQTVVAVRNSGRGFVIEQRSDTQNTARPGYIDICLDYSLLKAVKLPSGQFLYLSTGHDVMSEKQVIALSMTMESRIRTPENWVLQLNSESEEESKRALLGLYLQLLTENLLWGVKAGDSIAILNPCYSLGRILTRNSAERGVSLTLLTDAATGKDINTSPWTSIHPRATKRDLKRVIPRNLRRFIHNGSNSDLATRIKDALPPKCVVVDQQASTSLAASVGLVGYSAVAAVAGHLQVAWTRSVLEVTVSESHPLVDISKLATHPASPDMNQTFLSWSSLPATPVQVQPATRVVRFSPDKTYWMAGLTGSLGLSLCEWMAQRGAKYIALSSRNPRVDDGWKQAMANLGCTVRVFANDVTNRDEVFALHKRISETLPPIAGVVQGAMVLDDTLFPDVDLERFQKISKPKVSGSIHLDELFSTQGQLEFFVFCSSVAYVTGNAGQSIYGAASAFMASLATKRRRRGLEASVINIGAILGTGYVSRKLSLQQQEYLRKVGLVWMSEQDAHEIFAEGILASRLDSPDSPEFETGLRTDEGRSRDIVNEPPMLQHLGVRGNAAIAGSGTQTRQNIQTKARLLEATTHEEVFDILKEGFLLKLQAALQTDPDRPLLDLSLDEIGADSLVAVDIRSWFLKEAGANVPVLKILDSPSVHDLLLFAQNAIVPEVIPNVQGGAEISSDSTAALSSLPAVRELESSPKLKSDSSSDTTNRASPLSDPRDSTGEEITPETSELSSSEADDDGGVSKPTAVETAPSTIASSASGKTSPERIVPMSFAQSRFWFLKHYVQDQSAFNITTVIKLNGQLRVDALERALVAVGQRHEALRTFFFVDEKTKEPKQAVLPRSLLKLERVAISDKQELEEIVSRAREHVFDIERGEALRIQLVSSSKDTHWIVLGYHHIYMDGIGYVVFLSDWEKAYNGVLDVKPSGVLQYPDFSQRQIREYQTGAWSEELAFWRGQFPDLPSDLPLLPLAHVSARPDSTSSGFGSNSASFRIDGALAEKIGRVGQRFNIAPFHLHLAVFHLLLYRYSATELDDMVIGIADANRKDADVQGSLGLFLDLLPIRLRRSAKDTFANTLKDVRKATLTALGNSRVPFDVLLNELDVPRVPSRSPLFQAFMNYRRNQQEARSIFGCDGKLDIVATGQTDYDISIDILDLTADGGESIVSLAVRKDLYDQKAADVLAKSYRSLLRQFVDNPAVRVTSAALHSNEDIQSTIEIGRGVEAPSSYPTIVHRIDAIAEKYHSRTALKDTYGNVLTYRALASRVEGIARRLVEVGAAGTSKVGVFQTPGVDWICSLLAILRVGAAYVPLDPKVGPDRLSLITNDSQPVAILVDSHTKGGEFILSIAGSQPSSPAPTIIDVTNLPSAYGTGAVPNSANPADAAVIIYSSGSTGQPKGIVLSHSSIANYADAVPPTWGVREGQEVFLNQASYSFDVSLQQTIVALGIGSTVVVVGGPERGDPAALSQLIVDENITATGATPTEYRTWARHWDPQALRKSQWRHAFTWGEPITRQQIQDLQLLDIESLRVIDAYGPAEATITTAHGDVSFDLANATGNPKAPLSITPNGSVYIVDENLDPVPAGVPGEIVLGGAGVAKGYLNDDALTAERFIHDKFASPYFKSKGWTTAHRTGDRGVLTGDGRLILQGRVEGSTQVKLAGVRVDLQDVEATILQAIPGVSQTVVSARKNSESDDNAPFLVAFVVLSNTGLSPSEKARFLEELPRNLPLPQYLKPAVAVGVYHLPTNSSHKLDRRAIDGWPLPKPTTEEARTPRHDEDQLTELEAALRQLWEDALPEGLARRHGHSITSSSDFFHVGGSSLSLINLQGLIKERLNLSTSLYKLFQNSTLEAMAASLRDQGLTVASESNSIIDWESEAALPSDITQHDDATAQPTTGTQTINVVALTGATGFIGKEILRRLLADERVSQVYCLAVRKAKSDLPASLFSHPKVVSYPGDLGAPQLGLSEGDAAAIFGDGGVDAVIHAGADVSFLKTYNSLRLVNVASTRELIRLAAPRRLPLHFVSSATVARLALEAGRSSFGRESIAEYPPTTTRAALEDGYVSAKWVSEVLLERAAKQTGLPVWIHRPTSVAGEDASELDLMSNITKYVQETKTIPDTTEWNGGFDFVSVQSVGRDIVREVLDNAVAGGEVRYSFQSGEIEIGGDEMKSIMELGTGTSFDVLPFAQWVERAEQAGLNHLLALYLKRAAEGQLLIPKLLKE